MLDRGAGQLLGQRQSGPAQLGVGQLLSITDLAVDEEVLLDARKCAAELVTGGTLAALPASVLSALHAYRMSTLLKSAMQDIDMHVE